MRNQVFIFATRPSSFAATWLVAATCATSSLGSRPLNIDPSFVLATKVQFVIKSDLPQWQAVGSCLVQGPILHISGPYCCRSKHLNGRIFVSDRFSHYSCSPGTLKGQRKTSLIHHKFGVDTLILIFLLAFSFVPLLSAMWSVSAFSWKFRLPPTSLSTKESVDQESRIAIVSIEVFPLESVMGTVFEIPQHEFAVNIASAVIAVSQLQLVCFARLGLDQFSSLCKNHL